MNEVIKASVFTKQDFTDKSIIDFIAKHTEFSIGEYSNFLSGIKVHNNLSEELIRFIASYKGGELKPDRCNAYEPINKVFRADDLSQHISWLSQPGGAFYFLKNRGLKLEGAIENLRFSPIWSDGNLVKPVAPEPHFLGKIRFFFDGEIAKKKGIEFWLDFLNEVCNIANTKTAIFRSQRELDDVAIEENSFLVTDGARLFFA